MFRLSKKILSKTSLILFKLKPSSNSLSPWLIKSFKPSILRELSYWRFDIKGIYFVLNDSSLMIVSEFTSESIMPEIIRSPFKLNLESDISIVLSVFRFTYDIIFFLM